MLEVRDLSISFGSAEGRTAAVQSLSFSLAEGETLALVGESGSGKSVTALALTRHLPGRKAYSFDERKNAPFSERKSDCLHFPGTRNELKSRLFHLSANR